MKVNELYDEIYGFWSLVYPVIGFHLALIIVLKWINYPLPKISAYFNTTNDSRKTKIKDFIETFHLENVMPVFLIFVLIGYFALFNVAEGIYSSVRSIVPVFNINTNIISNELNNIADTSIVSQSNESLRMSDKEYNIKLNENYISSRFLVKFYRWNFLMELTEFLVIFLGILILSLVKKRRKEFKLIKYRNVALFLIISAVVMTFMRLKQEIFLYKAVKYNAALIKNTDSDKVKRLSGLLDKECKLSYFLKDKFKFDVNNLDEGIFSK